jgi:hypothetical protein
LHCAEISWLGVSANIGKVTTIESTTATPLGGADEIWFDPGSNAFACTAETDSQAIAARRCAGKTGYGYHLPPFVGGCADRILVRLFCCVGLRRARLTAGPSQRELAARSGIHERNHRASRTRRTSRTWSDRKRLAYALGLPATRLTVSVSRARRQLYCGPEAPSSGALATAASSSAGGGGVDLSVIYCAFTPRH